MDYRQNAGRLYVFGNKGLARWQYRSGESSGTYFLLLFSEYCSSPTFVRAALVCFVRAAGIDEMDDEGN